MKDGLFAAINQAALAAFPAVLTSSCREAKLLGVSLSR